MQLFHSIYFFCRCHYSCAGIFFLLLSLFRLKNEWYTREHGTVDGTLKKEFSCVCIQTHDTLKYTTQTQYNLMTAQKWLAGWLVDMD